MNYVKIILCLFLTAVLCIFTVDKWVKFHHLYYHGKEGKLTVLVPLNAWGKRVLNTTRVLGDLDGKKSVFVLDGAPSLWPANTQHPVIYFPEKIMPAESLNETDRSGLTDPEIFTTGVKQRSFREFLKARGEFDNLWIVGGFSAVFLYFAIEEIVKGLRRKANRVPVTD